MASVNSIPPEAQPYVLATAIVIFLFLAALVRLWLLRRAEAKLLKNKDALEKQIVLQQREIMAIRQDSNEWRAEMKRQFDIFRAMASDQLGVEEKRFNDLLKNSQVRQSEMQASLDMARQMCAELPAAKARVMQLEQALEIDGGEGLTSSPSAPAVAALAPLPDLGTKGKPAKPPASMSLPLPSFPPAVAVPVAIAPPPPPAPAAAPVDSSKLADLEQRLAIANQRNATLQQALTSARLRSRLKSKSSGSSRAKAFR